MAFTRVVLAATLLAGAMLATPASANPTLREKAVAALDEALALLATINADRPDTAELTRRYERIRRSVTFRRGASPS